MRRVLGAALAATLLGVALPAAAAPGDPPSRLWYRASLHVEETHEAHAGADVEQSSNWHILSKHAFIVELVCTRRATGERLADKPCAKAYQGRRRPAGAVNDLVFLGSGNAVWQFYELTATNPASEADNSQGHRSCTGRTERLLLTKAPHYHGSIGSSSLVHWGIGFSIQAPATKLGQIAHTISSYTCTYTGGDNDRTEVYPSTKENVPVGQQPWAGHNSWLLSIFDVARKMTLPSVGNRFGQSITIKRTVRKAKDTAKSKIEVELKLEVCGRGGRDVDSC
jgi:hypothetical protein